MIKKNKKNNKKKKKLIPYGKKELIFNVLSLVIAIGVGLYFELDQILKSCSVGSQ